MEFKFFTIYIIRIHSMNTYYVLSNAFYSKYNFFDLDKSEKSISQIQKEILSTPDFCRSQQSIATTELKSYLVSGISFFTLNNNLLISGLINFDINQNIINIMGLCVPGNSRGIGSFLIDKVKTENITTVFYIEFSNHLIADSIAEATGAETALLHSCHNVSKEDIINGTSYLSLMDRNFIALKEALG